jgi:hypothetical protein
MCTPAVCDTVRERERPATALTHFTLARPSHQREMHMRSSGSGNKRTGEARRRDSETVCQRGQDK